MELSVDWLKETVKRKGYVLYTAPYQLNIIGIRKFGAVNKFDDLICVMCVNNIGVTILKQFSATTKPGKPFLIKPINKLGTAILQEGQYIDTYRIDLHNGKYEALCQRLKPVKIWRDNNKNDIFDLKETDTGFFGINIHYASRWSILEWVGKNSAGCQVFQNPDDFDWLMRMARIQKGLYGNKFTYTLLNERDFIIDIKPLEIIQNA